MKLPSVIIFTLILSACATGTNPRDPYEGYNRKMYAFNQAFDSIFLKPAAKVYLKVLPAPLQTFSSNFFSNLNEVTVVANDLLQAEFKQAFHDSTRFFINSTVGVGGILDVASDLGLKKHQNDLGLTFAKWGDKNSPYLVLPLLGSSTIRDAYGLTFDYMLFSLYPHINPHRLRYALLIYYTVVLRAELLEATDLIEKVAIDEYAFQRDAYLQQRDYLIHGKKKIEEDDDLYVEDKEETNTLQKDKKKSKDKKASKGDQHAFNQLPRVNLWPTRV